MSEPRDWRNDRVRIVDAATEEIYDKYARGQAEHQTDFWTGGGLWFARQAREEAIDAISYTHHVIAAFAKVLEVADLLRTESVTGHDAARMLERIAGEHPPKKANPC